MAHNCPAGVTDHLVGRHTGGGAGLSGSTALTGQAVDRRDHALRERRDEAAAWLSVHPALLGSLDLAALHALQTRAQELEEALAENRRLGEASAYWERLARVDALTGLWSRRAIEEHIAVESERARRYARPLALLLCDVDRLKEVNDSQGHPAGDAVLRAVAARLRAGLRRVDAAGRWGGDEFLVVLPETDDSAAPLVAAKLLEQVVAEPVVHAGVGLAVSLSIGWAVALAGEQPRALIGAADAALYRAKAAGRGRVDGGAGSGTPAA